MSALFMSPPAQETAAAFRRFFRCELRRFWHPLFGFDIVRFDRAVIRSPDNCSMRNAIAERYGEDAAALVEEILAREMEASASAE